MSTAILTSPDIMETHTTKSSTRVITLIGRILLGLLFFVCGLNGFLNFIPPPSKPMPEEAMAFAGAMMKTGYFLQLVAGTQVIAGVLLLINRFVPLALVILAPVILNILAFHLFLEHSGLPLAIILTGLELYLAWAYRKYYYTLLTGKCSVG